MPATLLVFALYLNQIAVRVILVDFFDSYMKPFCSFRVVVSVTNNKFSAQCLHAAHKGFQRVAGLTS